jgi:hypothetical protein
MGRTGDHHAERGESNLTCDHSFVEPRPKAMMVMMGQNLGVISGMDKGAKERILRGEDD